MRPLTANPSCLKRSYICLAITLILIFSMPFHCANSSAAEKSPIDQTGTFGLKIFEPEKFILHTGDENKKIEDVNISPEIGLSHIVRERDQGTGIDNISHKVHARAGGKVNFNERFYLGFATKLPVYNYELSENRGVVNAGGPTKVSDRHDYEILRLSPENLTWTGEAGYQLSKDIKFNIFYDQNRFVSPKTVGDSKDEEVFGTRLDFHFK